MPEFIYSEDVMLNTLVVCVCFECTYEFIQRRTALCLLLLCCVAVHVVVVWTRKEGLLQGGIIAAWDCTAMACVVVFVAGTERLGSLSNMGPSLEQDCLWFLAPREELRILMFRKPHVFSNFNFLFPWYTLH